MKKLTNRRDFLKYTGITAIALTSSGFFTSCSTAKIANKKLNPHIPFIEPSYEDRVILSPGLEYQKLISSADPINNTELFGMNNDFIAFTPLKKNDEAILWVNHEAPHPYLTHKERFASKKTKVQVIEEQKSVGGSLIHVKKKKNEWNLVKNSKYNRRLSAETAIPFAAGAEVSNQKFATGTLANCSGGVTPWGTVLSCEENYSDFYGDFEYDQSMKIKLNSAKFGWERFFDYPLEHYGWVLEIDPFTGKAVKHISMGRFEHECAKTILAKDERTVVYLGDDKENEHLYKFISDKKGSLDTGTLYVAHLESGTWLPITMDNPKLKGKFKTLTDLLIQTRTAAKIVGASQLNRPEDIEILPGSNTVLVACTNNKSKLDAHGYILAIDEKNQDPLSLEFKSHKWLECGPLAGMSCPDNFVLDQQGNLWVTSDISEKLINDFPYTGFGNNGLFYIPTSGEDKGVVYQIASCPKEAEFTGPCFSADFKTLFICVQHPGNSSSETGYTSAWPDGEGKIPRSSVIAISGPLLDKLNSSPKS